MLPFIVLSGSFLVFLLLGAVGISALADPVMALRVALALMFLLTASAHWGKRRLDLVRMVPPAFPRRELLVTVTGVLEIAGAVGLLISPLAPYAATGLGLLMLAMFPANVHAVRAGLTLDGKPVTPLGRRTLLQVVFLAAAVTVALLA